VSALLIYKLLDKMQRSGHGAAAENRDGSDVVANGTVSILVNAMKSSEAERNHDVLQESLRPCSRKCGAWI
jgi:hypothetical protein